MGLQLAGNDNDEHRRMLHVYIFDEEMLWVDVLEFEPV